MIRKISVKNFGSLVDFSNVDNEFTKQDAVIHGLNGSGKSQLCSIAFQIEKLRKSKSESPANRDTVERQVGKYLASRKSKETSDQTIQIEIDSYTLNVDVISSTIVESGSAPALYVFNEDYVRENVGDIVNLRDQEIRIGQRNIERDRLVSEKNKKEDAARRLSAEIDDLITTARSGSGFPGQARTERIISREGYLASVNPGEAFPDARDQLLRLANPPEPLTSHIRREFPAIRLDNGSLELVGKACSRIVLPPVVTSSIHKAYLATKKRFFEDGVAIFEEVGDNCPFCLSPKTRDDPTIGEVIAYLNSDFSANQKILNGTIEILDSSVSAIVTFIETWNEIVAQANEKAIALSMDVRLEPMLFDEKTSLNIRTIIRKKIENGEVDLGAEARLGMSTLIGELEALKNQHMEQLSGIGSINEAIERITGLKRALGDKIIKNEMFVLWNNGGTRDRYHAVMDEIKSLVDAISQSSRIVTNDRIPKFFNQIIRILGIHKYSLSDQSLLLLRLDTDHNINNEGYRISTGERKFIAFGYFLAEVLASANSSAELQEHIVMIDDPVDSSDHDKFYSFVSVIEKLDTILSKIFSNEDIRFGQVLIFTHNALLFERLINSQNHAWYQIVNESNRSTITKPKKKISLATFSAYLRKITNYIKRNDPGNTRDIGNYIRRVLEIVCSLENIDSNRISNINASSKLNALANHLSHESIERMLDPLPMSHEYIAACIELVEEISRRVPNLYESIRDKYFEGKGIEEYRQAYEAKFMSS